MALQQSLDSQCAARMEALILVSFVKCVTESIDRSNNFRIAEIFLPLRNILNATHLNTIVPLALTGNSVRNRKTAER